ncbi:hypothetical protein [uncultured Cohaesibacter sp.]|uniref:hypothetical protein n=1 Tax=uncultured Cohaesibacter sp. TaxID=1002546 RepID=UPI0029C6CBE7|nr:hypothetical protein [uncultured Cohaesibacter sp.]
MNGPARRGLSVSALLLLATLAASPASAYSGENYMVCRLNPRGDNFLSLRSCGATNCQEIMRLGPDTPLRTLEPFGTRGWREVQVLPSLDAPEMGGYQTGWVFEKFICNAQY